MSAPQCTYSFQLSLELQGYSSILFFTPSFFTFSYCSHQPFPDIIQSPEITELILPIPFLAGYFPLLNPYVNNGQIMILFTTPVVF